MVELVSPQHHPRNTTHVHLSGAFDYVGEACPGIQGLSFADDVAWWAKRSRRRALGSAGLGRVNGVTNLRPRKDGGHVSVQAMEETHGIGTSWGARSPLQSIRHAVARSLDRLQDDPQGAPLREDEEGPKGDAVHSSLVGANGALLGRL